ncbi:Alkaline phosphatase synthesis sensor protein PhoR [compost metagenome]
MKLVIARVNLKELLQETMLNVWAKAEQKQIQLKLDDRTERPVIIIGDGNRLKQVFLNLVDNAIKFSSENSWIHLVISLKDSSAALVQVIDSGIGISDEHIGKVRDRFFQVNHNRGGTGLGLAISQQLVELHNGEMEIHSELGAGTTVSVTLPLLEMVGEVDSSATDATLNNVAMPMDIADTDYQSGDSLTDDLEQRGRIEPEQQFDDRKRDDE